VCGSEDRPAAQFKRFFLRHLVSVLGIKHTIRKGLSGTNTEKIPRKSGAIGIDIIKRRALLWCYLGNC
jgi:hypothetical protein